MRQLNDDEILELGLCPYSLASNAVYRTLREESVMRMIPTFQDVERLVDRYHLPVDALYVTTGKDDLVLFDGKMTFLSVYGIPDYLETLCEFWEQAKKRTRKMLEKGDYHSIFRYMDVVYRGKIIQFQLAHIPSTEQLALVLSVRRMMEYQFEDFDETTTIPVLLRTKEGASDLSALRQLDLPDVVTLYRGEGTKSTDVANALSWSLSRAQAEFFANRFQSNGTLFKASVRKDDILAYIASNEQEVLVRHADLLAIEEEKMA